MEESSMILSILMAMTVLAGIGSPPASDLFEIDTRQLADLWQKEHISPPDPYSLKHAQLKQRLLSLVQDSGGLMQIEQVGTSVAGREIYLVSMGSGMQKILIWSQMHGNEPTATCSLLDLFQFFQRHRQEPWVADILAKYRLLFIPMLNPDGAERDERRNAQGIDINRDARMLQTPEGQILKAVRDRFDPFLGFNLHNQSGLTTVGDTGKVATIALLAVAADAPGGKPRLAQPGVPEELAKRVSAVLYEALSPFIYGHISRYDDPFNPRAFGDNLTLMGTPIVLIESGGIPAGAPANLTVQLNYVGLLAVLNSLSTGRVRNANPAVFDALKLNSDTPIYDLILQNAWIFNGSGIPLFRGDIAIRGDVRAGSSGNAVIADVGDLGVYSAKQVIDCTGTMVTPGLIAWDPDRSLFRPQSNGFEYLRRGIATIFATAPWSELQNHRPVQEDWSGPRELDWGFLVVGGPAREDEKAQLQLATWLAAGGRAWVTDMPGGASVPPGLGRVATWFATETPPRSDMVKYQVPAGWSGDPARILTRWTSEAARAFRLTGRGTIATGSRADLVIWKTPSDKPPAEIRDCVPSKIILNGRVVDLSEPAPDLQGRFLGRR
jgi:hypothetical protein